MAGKQQCNLCGELKYKGNGSLPEGQYRCQPCRRIRPSPTGPQGKPHKQIKPRQCPECLKTFSKKGKQLCCSYECSVKYRTGTRIKHCLGSQCTSMWVMSQNNKGNKYCSKECRERTTFAGIQTSTPWRSDLILKQCPMCPAWYVYRQKKLFCSLKCSQRKYPPKELQTIVCKCGKTFETKSEIKTECYSCMRRRYPSKHRKRARRYGVKYQPGIKRTYIFERDSYRCHICKKMCRVGKAWSNHPLDPTIDHLIPMSLGGDHVVENLATACFSCNSVKSNVLGGDQLMLIG